MTTARPLPPGELPRKAVHLGMAGFALLLRWLTWEQAAACAVAAFLFNLLLLPRLLGHRLDSGREGASDRGVLLYPVVVLGLILLFHRTTWGLALPAFGWGLLAGGDAAAGLVGMRWGRHPLPWNRDKSWEGLTGYLAGGALLGTFLARVVLQQCPLQVHGAVLGIVLGTALAAALESLPHGLDDNVLPPLAGTLVLTTAVAAGGGTPPATLTALAAAAAINLAIALAAAAVRLLEPAGLAAAWLLGTVTLGLGTWRAYLLLWIFLAGGLLVTRVRRGHKRARGLEDERRRGLAHVAANGGLCLVGSLVFGCTGSPLASLLIAAGLASALADTAASEIGKAFGQRAYLLPALRPVPPGTEGAVSLAGTLAGLAGSVVVAGVAGATGSIDPSWIPLVAGSGFAAMLIESAFPRLGAATNTGTNLANTVIGGLLAVAVGLWL